MKASRVQIDEIWSFCYAKQKNVTEDIANAHVAGDVWTFVAIDADSKLVLSWLVGKRDSGCATEFLQDVAARLASRVQLTTDGHKMYLSAVLDASRMVISTMRNCTRSTVHRPRKSNAGTAPQSSSRRTR